MILERAISCHANFFFYAELFRGHIKIIQMSALQSWARVFPPCEIIIFGQEEGIAEDAFRFGARRFSEVVRNE
jgi:hypothetical protein